MKYLLTLLAFSFVGCMERPNFKDAVVEKINQNGNECVYTLDGHGSFRDACGKFNIGDTVKTTK